MSRPLVSLSLLVIAGLEAVAALNPTGLRTEWLSEPQGIDSPAPRLSWRVESAVRGDHQTAYQILVSTERRALEEDRGDLWDSGKVTSGETLNRVCEGLRLASGQKVYWKLRVWDHEDRVSSWSALASWSVGLMDPEDWQAQWISYRDGTPLHRDRGSLFLPPARHYRKSFRVSKPIQRATLHASALGIAEFYVNGQRVGDAYFEPGWSDYSKRAYYRTHDVTALMDPGTCSLGAIVADGWYAGYLGYGLLVGYGPNQVGRYFYGKTPALLAQLEIQFVDGSRTVIGTDTSWQVSGGGPFREADFLMGETFDARLDRSDWTSQNGASDWEWERAIPAKDNGSTRAVFSDNRGRREVELGFQAPPILQAYAAPPIRVTEELKPRKFTRLESGRVIFDLGQNFAGVVRLRVKGPAGIRIQLRHGEMLHTDGRLMTENLRRARAIDTYILGGDPEGEVWSPRFTYHGFQYVEVTGLPEEPSLETVTGLVLHNDTPLAGSFSCSDEVMTRFWKNTQWTQRANFVEVPTDCPQRDERLGWMGDAQTYVRTASFNADVAAFFNKWLEDVEESQLSFGAYPDYAPYPMGHGAARKTFGSAWTDAGIICPWTIWQVYDDTRVLERHWDSMNRFMEWRIASSSDNLGTSIGNTWGDWLNVGENTPIEFIDTAFYALDARLMSDMARALGHSLQAEFYRDLRRDVQSAFNREYVNEDGTLTIDTQTAYALALAFELLPANKAAPAGHRLAEKIAANGHRMTTGFLGTKQLLPALTRAGHHDLAVRLFQSREFPSWGYEVVNGANTVWERWDSYTREHGFNGAGGNQNASMNSFSHYAFGAVMEWAFRHLAGIDSLEAGYRKILIRPQPPAPGSNPDQSPISWVQAEYNSARGRIVSHWQRRPDQFLLEVTIPANTKATVHLPARSLNRITESGYPLSEVHHVKSVGMTEGVAILEVGSGTYHFESSGM